MLDSVAQSIWSVLLFVINNFLSVIMAPLNVSLQHLMVGILSTQQVLNFYNVLNSYVLPTCNFFIDLIPPMTWDAILLFITFYGSLFSIVFVLHWVLKVLRIIKRLIPFV